MRSLLILSFILCAFSLQANQHNNVSKSAIDTNVQKNKKPTWSRKELKLMKESSANLAKAMPSPGIQIGEKAPDFSLKNSQGNTVTLKSELAKGPVILVFYRGAWCPYCNLQLRSLKEYLPEFKKYNAQLITITPQTPDKSVEQFEKEGFPFEVLSDLNYQVTKDYKLYFDLSNDVVDVYKKHGLDLASYNGKGRTALPVPGTFIIDTNGIVRAMMAQTDFKIRMESSDIVKALSTL